jgi:hypothetical protein
MALRLGFGIFPKLLLTMLVVTLIPLGAIWYLDYRTESENLSNQIEQRLSGQADTMVGYVDAWVDMHLRMLRQNAALEDMAAMDGKKQKPLLRAIAAEYKWVYLAFTIAPDGNNVGRNDEEPPRFYGDRGYFKQAIEELKKNIAARKNYLQTELQRPDPVPLRFPEKLASLSNWSAFDVPERGIMDRTKAPDGTLALHKRGAEFVQEVFPAMSDLRSQRFDSILLARPLGAGQLGLQVAVEATRLDRFAMQVAEQQLGPVKASRVFESNRRSIAAPRPVRGGFSPGLAVTILFLIEVTPNPPVPLLAALPLGVQTHAVHVRNSFSRNSGLAVRSRPSSHHTCSHARPVKTQLVPVTRTAPTLSTPSCRRHRERIAGLRCGAE